MLKLNFTTQIFVGILLFVALLSVSVSFILKKRAKKYIKEIKRINMEKSEHIDEIKRLCEKSLEATVSNYENAGLKNFNSEANAYFVMSLTQNYFESLRIEYLKAAAKKKHLFASLILGNLYETGLTYNNREILHKDYDEAQKLYMNIKDNDGFGVSEWLLGWFCEKRLTTEAKGKSIDETLNQAKYYY